MRRPRPATTFGLVLVAAGLLALLYVGITNALVYYVTPTELVAGRATGSTRLYGIVEPGSVRWDANASTLSFRLTDGSTSLDVFSRALPTGLFRDGIGVVVAGRLVDARSFEAEEVLVKHSEVYETLRPGETVPPDLLERLQSSRP